MFKKSESGMAIARHLAHTQLARERLGDNVQRRMQV